MPSNTNFLLFLDCISPDNKWNVPLLILSTIESKFFFLTSGLKKAFLLSGNDLAANDAKSLLLIGKSSIYIFHSNHDAESCTIFFRIEVYIEMFF